MHQRISAMYKHREIIFQALAFLPFTDKLETSFQHGINIHRTPQR
jgi:hypothetical protein